MRHVGHGGGKEEGISITFSLEPRGQNLGIFFFPDFKHVTVTVTPLKKKERVRTLHVSVYSLCCVCFGKRLFLRFT